MDLGGERKSTAGDWITLGILTLVFVVGELSHFLLGIVTRPQSQDLQYGPRGCLNNPEFLKPVSCYEAPNETSCEIYGNIDASNETACVWDFSGLGFEYQILAGPAFIAVFTVSGIFIGILSDKFSRKIVVTVSLAVLTVATALMGTATKYWHLVIYRMLIGAGESAFSPACSSMISDIFKASQRGLALGIFNWGIYLGYGLSYAIGNLVTAANVAELGWRFSYFSTGFLGIAVFLLLLIIVKEPERGEWKSEINEENTEVRIKYFEEEDGRSSPKKEDGYSKAVSPPEEESRMKEIINTVSQPVFIVLTIAACIRHTAGFTWAYNTQLYFSTYYPEYNLGFWISGVSIIGGTIGVTIGGFVSDRLVKRLGLRARLYVLAGSQALAAPFAVGVLTLAPPYAFYSLVGSYIFAEMWFGVLFAVLLELIPTKIQSTTIAVFLFVMNNVGGNAPVIITPLRRLTSYRTSLYIMYPFLYFLSAFLFVLTSFFIKRQR